MVTQDPKDGAHLRLPEEVARLEKAVSFFKSSGDEKMLSQLVPQLDGAKDRLEHAVKAAVFVEKLGFSHEVSTHGYTFNDAVNVVAKALHETEHGVTASLYTRAHKHLDGVNDGAHCCPVKVREKRDPAKELIEILDLKEPGHTEAAKSLFGKVK
jgi:hypothetical protein